MYGYTQDKDKYLNRLRRIEGQVRGLEKMVEEDKYCIDILTQVAAATSALQSVALGLLEDHLGHCVAQATAEGGEVGAAKVREASEAIARLVKSLPSRPARRRSPGSSPTGTDRPDGPGQAPRPSAGHRASPLRRAAPTLG